MKLTLQYKNAIYGIIVGALIGITLWIFLGNIFYLILMILIGLLVSLFCKGPQEIPEEEEKKFYDQ